MPTSTPDSITHPTAATTLSPIPSDCLNGNQIGNYLYLCNGSSIIIDSNVNVTSDFIVTSPVIILGNYTQSGTLEITSNGTLVVVRGCAEISGDLNIIFEDLPDNGTVLDVISFNGSCSSGEFQNINTDYEGKCFIIFVVGWFELVYIKSGSALVFLAKLNFLNLIA